MKPQIFSAWKPKEMELMSAVSLEEIVYGRGLKIVLREVNGAKRILTLEFPDLPNAVRIANESYRLKTLPLLPADPTSFYIVENSEFINWFHEDSLGIYSSDPLFHLAIITDEWIDIICNEEPSIMCQDPL